MKRKIPNSPSDIEVLSMPWFPQQDQSYYCFPYSLWMIIQYYRNIYENDLIRSNTPEFTVEELAKICKTNKFSGTRINEQLISDLRKRIPSLQFQLVRDASFDQIQEIINENCPCIINYDCGYLLCNVASKVGHAGVVIGIDNQSIYLNNPWLGAEVGVDKVSMGDAWEIEYNQIIIIKPQLQTNLNGGDFEKNARKTSN